MAVVASTEAVDQALERMQAMLGADGFGLDLAVDRGRLSLTVRATPEACADCLVPKELLATIALTMLAEQGIAVSSDDITVIYP